MTTCRIQLHPTYRLHITPRTSPPHPLLLFVIVSIALHCLVLAIPATPTAPGNDRAHSASQLDVYLADGQAQHRAHATVTRHQRSRHHARTDTIATTRPRNSQDTKTHKPMVSPHADLQPKEWFHTADDTHSQAAQTNISSAQQKANAQQAADKPSPDPSAVALILRRALLQHFRYPAIARENAWQGKVVLKVRVEANGRVHSARILHPSQYAILDRAARRAANAIGAIPSARPLLAGQGMSFRVPVAYHLQP